MTRRQRMAEAFRARFGHAPDLWVRAPGRVDLMGSHTDYNQGCVMTQAIDRDIWIAARRRSDAVVRAASLNLDEAQQFPLSESSADSRCPGWAKYVQAVALVLEGAGHAVTGADLLVHGTVPLASGLSSSAALEVATATLFEHLGGYRLDPLEKARLCQRAENEIVGVGCGLLDQYSSVMGEKDRVLLLDCRDDTHSYARFPEGLRTVVCDTRAPRQLAGSEYALRREQCRAAADWFGRIDPACRSLRDVSESLFERHASELDPVTARRARFVIEENARVDALARAFDRGDRPAIGRLMAESYAGADTLYEITVPAMEAMLQAMRRGPGVVGARQAGAGFGGCMVALVEQEQVAAFCAEVARAYEAKTSIRASVYGVEAADGAGPVPEAGAG